MRIKINFARRPLSSNVFSVNTEQHGGHKNVQKGELEGTYGEVKLSVHFVFVGVKSE